MVVVGAGNAALCAALSAQEGGARVLVLEKAPLEERGGNSLFTAGGFRFVHDGVDDLRKDVLTDLSEAEVNQIVMPKLSKEQYMEDLMRVTEDESDEQLAEMLIGRSRETIVWMRSYGVRFIPMFGRQSYKVEGKHHFYGGVNIEAVGGGFGLVEALIKRAERLGIEIRYGTELRELRQDQKGKVTGARVKGPQGYEEVAAKAVVLACGGFEANPEMRTRYLGPGWELCRVRGTRHNTGGGIRAALDIGAQPFGGWSTCHAVQWDISAPPFGDRVVLDNFQKHSYPIGIVVNLKGERFIDEGADYRNHTYAKYGREVMKQPRRTAVQIFDAKTIGMVRDEYRIKQVSKFTADSLEELAKGLDIDPQGLVRTVNAVQCGMPAGYLQSVDPRWREDRGHRAAQIELGAADRQAAVHGLHGDLRHHVHVRRPAHRSQCRCAGHGRRAYPRPVRRRRARRGHFLRQLSGRRGSHVGRGLRPTGRQERF